MRKLSLVAVFLVVCSMLGFAADKKVVMGWPKDKPIIEITFGTFRQMANYGRNNQYSVQVDIENLTDKPFPSTTIPLVFFDKDGIRIGQSGLYIYPELPGHQKARDEMTFSATGTIAKLEFGNPRDVGISANHEMAAHVASMTIRSIPSGAEIDIDGKTFGPTPKVLRIPAGSHTLTLTKAGFDKGVYPFDVANDEGNGGAVEVELPLSQDVLELRDGSWVGGDVEKIDWDTITLVRDGQRSTYKRNDVKRIMLVPRMKPEAAPAGKK